MEIIAKDNLFKALGVFIEAFRTYIVATLIKISGDGWEDQFKMSLYSDQVTDWDKNKKQGSEPQNLIDYHHLKGFALRFKEQLREDFEKNVNKLPTWFEEIAEVRHKCNHYQELSEEEVSRAYSTMILIAGYLTMKELETELIHLRDNKPSVKQSTSIEKNSSGAIPWFKNVQPHLDIRQGTLDESVFAANLSEVALGTGREAYKSAPIFFSKTYFTTKLKSVATLVIKGLNGGEDADNRIVSLQTGFGGGKTHALITLYHIANLGKKLKDSSYTKELLSATGLPVFDNANIAVFTNTTNDPTQGRQVGNVHIRTLWGEIAYQLGGEKAYNIIKENDQQRTTPKGLFKKVLEETKPALILIDELADYCIPASAITVGQSSNLFDQTNSFIQELTGAISETDQCVLVATLPASVTEVANSAMGEQILSSLSSRLSRVGSDHELVSNDEIYEVIRRRLFEDLGSEELIEKAINNYEIMYDHLLIEIPDFVRQPQYKEKLRKAYPFHPELIDMFRIRWASNPQFQRTRGVLRLLAAIVSNLWKRQNLLVGSSLLIHPSDVNFENLDAITGQLKKLFGNGYEAVISGDVSGSSSNAFKLDTEKKEYGHYNLTQGITASILLGSFGSVGANKGLSIQELKLCVLKPDSLNHNSVNGAIDALEGRAHYLYSSALSGESKRYWFHTKPNINILINQAKAEVKVHDINLEILKRINEKINKITPFKVLLDPTSDIPEQKEPTLIILGPQYLANPEHINGNTRKMIEKLSTKKGNSERIYRNTFLYLLCSEVSIGQLNTALKDYLGCILVQKDYSNLEPDQKEDLKKKIEEFSRKVTSSIVTAYSIVAKYSVKAGIDKLLITQFKESIDLQINTVIWDLLKNEEWMLENVGLGLLKNNGLFPSIETSLRVKDVYEAFIRFDDKQMIVGPSAISQSLLRFCLNGELAIASGDGKDFNSIYYKQNVPFFNITDESYWVVDKTLYKPPVEKTSSEETAVVLINTNNEPVISTNKNPMSAPRTIRTLRIKGKVGLENYNQIFTSFIQPLVNNQVEIKIEISGKSTGTNPMSENSLQYKITKESARQLGLEFEEE